MDSTHGLMHACSQTCPGPAAQKASPGQTGSTPRTLPGIALFPPECRVTEPLSNWKTSFGLAEQGRSFLCQLLLLTALLLSTATYLGMLGRVRETTSRQPPLPPTLSINLLGILPPHYPRQTPGRPCSRARGHNLPRAMHEPADLDSDELGLVAPMWWQQIMSRLPRVHAHT